MKAFRSFFALSLCCASWMVSAAEVTPEAFEQAQGLQGYQVTYLDKQGQVISAADYLERYGMNFSLKQDNATLTAIVSAAPLQNATQPFQHLAPTSLAKGDSVPAIQGKNLMGHSIKEDWSSKKFVLISTFFANCSGCVSEIPDIKGFSERHPNVKVLYVTWDSIENSRAFAGLNGVDELIIAEAKPWLEQVGINTYPTVMLLSPTGRLLHADAGYDVEGRALQKMAELLIPAV